MKKIFIFLVFGILFSTVAAKVKIVENYTDDFTNEKIKTTSWVNFKSKGGMNGPAIADMHLRFKTIDDKCYLELRHACNNVLSIEKDSKLMFKTPENIFDLSAIKNVITSKGEGSINYINSAVEGYTQFYTGDFKNFPKDEINKIRVYTTTGYYDVDIPQKTSKEIIEAYKLITAE